MCRNILCSILLLAVAMMSLPACTSSHIEGGDTLSLVPADASLTAVVDLRRCLIEAGCHSRHGRITLTDDAEAVAGRYGYNDALRAIALNGDCCSLDFFTLMRDSLSQRVYAVVARTPGAERDFDTKGLEPCGEGDSQYLGEVNAYTAGNACLLVADDYVWIVPREGAPKAETLVGDLDKMLARAVRSSAGSIDEYHALLADSVSLARIYARIPVAENPLGDCFDAVQARVQSHDSGLTFDASFIDASWRKVDPLASMPAVDAGRFDRVIPRNTAFLLAFAADSVGYRTLVRRYLNRIPSIANRFVAKSMVVTMGPMNGTTAIALAPGGSRETIADFSPYTWQYCLELPASNRDKEGDMPARLDNWASAIVKLMPEVRTKRTADGWCIQAEALGGRLYWSDIKGGVAFTNYPLGSDVRGYGVAGCDIYSLAATGSKVFFGVTIPYRSELMHALDLPAGVSASVVAAPGGDVHGTLSVKGGDMDALQFLANILAR